MTWRISGTRILAICISFVLLSSQAAMGSSMRLQMTPLTEVAEIFAAISGRAIAVNLDQGLPEPRLSVEGSEIPAEALIEVLKDMLKARGYTVEVTEKPDGSVEVRVGMDQERWKDYGPEGLRKSIVTHVLPMTETAGGDDSSVADLVDNLSPVGTVAKHPEYGLIVVSDVRDELRPWLARHDPRFKGTYTEPPVTFRGKVVGPDGKGLAGATVRNSGDGRNATVETEMDGSFEMSLGSLLPGNWLVLEASHVDMPAYRGMLIEPVTSGTDFQGEIQMKRTGAISGRVVNEDGNPIPSATVETLVRAKVRAGALLWPHRDDETDESGRYEFEDVIAGIEYRVNATAEGYGRDNTGVFEMSEGEKREPADLVLVLADQIVEGDVVDDAGYPVAGAQIQCLGRATGPQTIQTDDDGHFRIEGLAQEAARLWIRSPNTSIWTNIVVMAGDTDVRIVVSGGASLEERAALRLVGKQAPELDVAEWIHGEETSLERLRGQIVVLAFWDSADESSGKVVETLNSLAEQHTDVAIIAVLCADGDEEALQELVDKENISFRVALDIPSYGTFRGATFEKYGVRKPPSVYIIDAEGTVKFQDLALAVVEEAVERVIAGE